MPSRTLIRTLTGRALVRVLALLMVASGSAVFIAASSDTASAGITATFNQVFSADTTGSIQIRGNTILTCQDTATSCAAARAQLNQNDNSFFDTYIDIDSDPTTFDSSSSTVNIPSGGSVLFAALVWGGNTTAGGSLTSAAYGTGTAANSPTPANAGTVKLMVPGSSTYTTINSSRTSFLSGSTGNYQGYADVTSAVQAAGNGSYTVANIQTATGTNIQGGWALAIAYSNPTDPPRDLTIFSGFGTVGAGNVVDIPVSGFKTPPTGAVTTTLGAISYEGDAASVGDQLLLGNTTATLQNVTDALHPVANSFTSVISDLGVDSSTRNPDYLNQLGFDAATFNVNGVLTNGSTSADIRMTSAASGGETYYPGVITFATDLYSPDLSATKSVALVAKGAGNTQAGVVEPGDTLQYTINATNSGQDSSVGTVLTDAIPAGTTYVAGSLTSGGTALTDATGDDIGSFNGTTKQLTVDVGTSATATVGGNVAVAASIATITFEVTVNANIADGTSIPNTAALTYKGNQTGTAVTGASNAVTTPTVRHHSALTITKTANLARVQKGAATPVTYTLTASNAGPYDDPGVTVTDTLPSGAVVKTATPSAGSCTTPAGQVVCNIGALANGASATVAVTVTLDSTTDPATDTASIVGTNVDSNQSDNTASVSTIVDTAPVANADSATTSAGPAGTATIAVLANDTDADGDPLTASAGATVPTKGGIVVNANNTITYTANAGAVGTDTFSYVANDGRGGTATGTVTVTIPNQLPIANADSGSTTPGQPVTVNVLGNDTDPNIPASGQVLSVSAITQPAGGKGTVTTNGTTVTFTPSGTFKLGSTSFTYTVSDGDGGTAVGNVTVTVPNVPPTAVNDTATTPYLAPTTVDVLANDTDANGDALTVTTVTGEAHGTAVITGSGVNTKILYTPASGWSGADTMTYTVSDGTTTSTAVLTVTTADAPPSANNFSTSVAGGIPTTVDVVAHASDPNSDTLTVTAAGPATHGTVSIGAGGVVYTPNAAYAGTDTFSYTVDDGHGGTATATVTVTVGNQAPVANADSAIATGLAGSPITVDVLANDTDANSDPLTLISVSVPAHGTAALVAGKVVYTPSATYAGPDTFTYSISDGNGGTATGTVSVDVQNRRPIANPDTLAALSGTTTTVDVVANDTDPDGETVSLLSVDPSSANGGTETITGGLVHYTSAPAYVGTDTFSYVVTDPRGGTATGTVTVTVGSSAMIANSRTAATATNTPVTVGLLSGVTDPGGHPISVDSAGSAAHGTVTLDSSGNATYTPAAGYSGSDTFTYAVSDAFGGSASSTVTVTVANANPVTVDDTASVLTGNSITVDVLANDTDPNIPATSQSLSLSSASLVSGTAAVTVTAGGVQVVPGIGFTGDVVVQYVVSDGAGGSATGQLTVHVTSPFVPPVPPVVPPAVVSPLKPIVIVGPTTPAKAPSHVEAATTVVTIVPAEISVTLDPTSAVAGLGTVTIMSVSPNPTGVQVQVVDGKLVVTRTNKYVGTTTFNYTGMAKNGTEVNVTVTAHVLGETITAPSLPFTGANVELSMFAGAMLVFVGLFAIWITRRKPVRNDGRVQGGSADFR
ncbi:MAG TPA: Ig-like domain-containing protein [Acidothermaceae bacterium]